MDRRAGSLAIAAVAAACGRPAVELPSAQVAARGTLGYAVAFSRTALYTIELDERFALFVRDPDSGAVRSRIELGPPERDLVALAVAEEPGGDVVWLGGGDHAVRAIDPAGATVATWPIGAPVTALAVLPGGTIAIGDAMGVLCLRRRGDGALLHCVLAGDGPITALERDGTTLTAAIDGARAAFALPSLAPAEPGPAPPQAVVEREVHHAGRAVARFAGPARAAAYGPRGQLAAVGWIQRLDDPSVVVIAPERLPRPAPSR